MLFVNLKDNFASLQYVVRIVKNIFFLVIPTFSLETKS